MTLGRETQRLVQGRHGHDAVGLLLVVRLIERARTRATRGPAPTASALDAFLGDCEALVRPRLLAILSQNLDGVKKAELSRLGVVSTAPRRLNSAFLTPS